MTHVVCSGVVRVAAAMAEAFPLFTPEGERRWVPGWDPEYLPASASMLHEGLAFRTTHGGETTLWVVSRLDQAAGSVDYVRVTPGSRMGRVAVRCADAGANSTSVTVTYQLSALSPEGEQALARFADGYEAMLREWERAIEGRGR